MGVSLEDQIGLPAKRPASGTREPVPKIQQQPEQVTSPAVKQRMAAEVLKSLLA